MWQTVGGLSALIAVAAGAFGAHALRAALSPESLTVYETGVRYQMYHALAMVLVGCLEGCAPRRGQRVAGALFLVGTMLFSGSLYGVSLSGVRWLGAVTPAGGAAFLAGWLTLALSSAPGLWRRERSGRGSRG
jgi:uncharacterized membrane protein YgdD (TMEM256/DUF423 family)